MQKVLRMPTNDKTRQRNMIVTIRHHTALANGSFPKAKYRLEHLIESYVRTDPLGTIVRNVLAKRFALTTNEQCQEDLSEHTKVFFLMAKQRAERLVLVINYGSSS